MSANRSHTISPPDIGSVFSFFAFGLVSAFGNEKGSFSTSFSSENISVNKKARVLRDPCTGCKLCVLACPTDAIVMIDR